MNLALLKQIKKDQPNLHGHISFNMNNYCDNLSWTSQQFYYELKKLEKAEIKKIVKQ